MRKARLGSVVGLTLGLFAAVSNAHAMSRDVRTVLRSGMWGAVAGTAVGIVSYAAGSSGRSVFVGSSVGLYFGLILGSYYVWERNSPAEARRDSAPEADRINLAEFQKAERRLPESGKPPLVHVQFAKFEF